MENIELLRQDIAKIDQEILKLIARRQAFVSDIAFQKKARQREIIDLAQEQKQYDQYQQWAHELYLSPAWVNQLFALIIAYSRETQKTAIK